MSRRRSVSRPSRAAALRRELVGQRRRVAELERLATVDPLTGLANRRAFWQRLGEAVALATRERRALSLVLLDLDHFKAINDTHGHAAGDRVLAEVARRLAAEARPGDVLARVGGEELAWLLPGTGARGALAAAERARRALGASPLHGAITVTASAGVCELRDAPDAGDLYRRADDALYWAKAHGRDMTLTWDPGAAERMAAARAEADPWDRLLAAATGVEAARSPAGQEGLAAHLAVALAVQRGWSPEAQGRLHQAARVRDVGQAALPDDVLRFPAVLGPVQVRQLRRHAAMGAVVVASALDAEQVAWIHHHHARWDGAGSPDGLAGDAIPEGAQLLAIADALEVTGGDGAALHEVDRLAGALLRPDAGRLARAAVAWLGGVQDAAGHAARVTAPGCRC